MDHFWLTRLARVKAALEANGFTTHIAENGDVTCRLVADLILPAATPCWGTCSSPAATQ